MHAAMPGSRHPRGTLEKFYNCVRWRPHTRNAVLFADPLCVFVLADGTRCPRLATDVHHKVDATIWIAAGNDFYDLSNLEGLCKTHHSHYTGSRR
jgi:hypothetical protein